MLRLAVLVSGGGTNLQAILDAIDEGTITNVEVSVVISNNAGAYALERAKKKMCIRDRPPPLQVGEDVTFFMRNPVSGLEKQRRLW